jgi:hypothetical protein
LLIFVGKSIVMPVPPQLIAQGASFIPAIAQGITGMVQSSRARKILENLNRPQFEIPTAVTEALGTARTLASTNQLPNQVQAEMAINQGTANSLYNINQNATSGTEALAAITGVAANENAAMNDLSGRAAVFSQQQNQNLINQLSQYANWQQNEWDYNVNQPYQMKLAEGQALAGAGMQNKYEALKGASGGLANIFGQKALMENGGNAMGVQSPERTMMFNQLPTNPFLRSNNMMLDAPATNLDMPMGERTTMFDNIAVLPNTFAMRKNSFYNPQ